MGKGSYCGKGEREMGREWEWGRVPLG